jgi:ABC-type transport system involved in cytochrome c biogenesis permease subunit
MDGIKIFCFGASYAVALFLELLQLVWPRRVQRLLAIAFGSAGLLAHTLFLAVQRPPLAVPFGSILFLAWILAVFYLYGSLHHRRLAWAVFVLPLVLALIALAWLSRPDGGFDQSWLSGPDALGCERLWGIVHGALLLLAAVGVCVGFVASVMYLAQARQLKAKVPPDHGLRLMSLERLEEMNRRAINLAFPLLTAGVFVGVALMAQRDDPLERWAAPKIIGTVLLWLAFAVLLYLRYGFHLRGRRLAVLTIVAFVLLLVTLASAHPLVQGGVR